jgi:hypothetical protein
VHCQIVKPWRLKQLFLPFCQISVFNTALFCHYVTGRCHNILIFIYFQQLIIIIFMACILPFASAEIVLERRKTMIALWIVIGCLFLTGIGIRFMYRVLGLTPVEATAVFVLIVMLVGVNTGPARQIIAQLF